MEIFGIAFEALEHRAIVFALRANKRRVLQNIMCSSFFRDVRPIFSKRRPAATSNWREILMKINSKILKNRRLPAEICKRI